MPETSVHFYDITRFSIREGKLPNTWKDAREPQQDRSNVMTNNYWRKVSFKYATKEQFLKNIIQQCVKVFEIGGLIQ